MSTYLGIDGGIGRLRNPDYSDKAIGTKVYVKTFGRMGLDGGIIANPRSYVGKVEVAKTLSGGVQAQDSIVAGVITRTALRTISGAVEAQSATVSGVIPNDKTVSGAVQAQSSSVSGAIDNYPLSGWSLIDFTVDYAGLDTDSPFASNPTYQDIAIGDKCHFETLTSPSASTMTMDGAGEFTITPPSVVIETFDFQIYDASDGTFGTSGTITINPADADVVISDGVQAQSATVSGSVNSFTVNTLSGAVQSQPATMTGVVVTAVDTTLIVGGVQAQSPTVSGLLEVVNKVSGGVQAQSATVTGSLSKVVKMSGALQAQGATLSGAVGPSAPVTTPPNRRTILLAREDRSISIILPKREIR